jgi:release factor glutamine methyltransferase
VNSAESSTIARLRAAGCVFAEEEAALLLAAAKDPADLEALTQRRVAGIPLEHLIGWAEFCGLRIEVDPGVFVPRQRTEFLVRRAVRALARAEIPARTPVVLDLCCGSGAIGVAIGERLANIELHAADIDPAAVACARRNVGGLGGVYEGDLFEALPATLRGRIDVVAANAPYVPTDAIGMMPPEARQHEARVALDGGPDGLDLHRRIAALAPEWLAPGGLLLLEASEEQAPVTAEAMAAAGLTAQVVHSDDFAATIVIGRKL